MSLRTIFKTAVYCSPTIAGVSANFVALGATVQAAALLGGAAMVSTLFYLREAASAGERYRVVEASQELQDIHYRLSQKVSLASKIGIIAETEKSKRCDLLKNAYADRGNFQISVGAHIHKTLSADESEFVVAHEMGHLADPDGPAKDYASTVMAMHPMMLGACLLAYFLPDNSGFLQAQNALIIGAVSQFLLNRKLSRSGEYTCDRRAVELTDNPQAAIRALEALKGKENFEILSTHPCTAKRIAAIRKIFNAEDVESLLANDMARYEKTALLSAERSRMEPVFKGPAVS